MLYNLNSYRFAKEIIESERYAEAWQEIETAVRECPLYIWPGKSATNPRLDVVQQLLNVYFERRLHIDMGWEFHPDATTIQNSQLKADFRKTFDDLTVQAEVQFGNMARWYTDIFKFQAGYSGKAVRMGVSIIPMQSLAQRIDSNVTHYERVIRELPAAELSITLPILNLGIEPGQNTPVIDVSQSQFATIKEITGKGRTHNRWRVVNNILNGVPIEDIGPDSEVGPYLEDNNGDE